MLTAESNELNSNNFNKMKIQKCEINGIEGWRSGDGGVCYIGTGAKQRANRDLRLEKAIYFEKNPSPLPAAKNLKKHSKKLTKSTKA